MATGWTDLRMQTSRHGRGRSGCRAADGALVVPVGVADGDAALNDESEGVRKEEERRKEREEKKRMKEGSADEMPARMRAMRLF